MKTKSWLRRFLLLIVSAAVILLIFNLHPKQQAKRSLKLLYTAEASEQLDPVEPIALLQIYQEKFDKNMTENGINDAIRLRLPYGLLNRKTLVERTSVNNLSLSSVELHGSKHQIYYLFRLQVITYYDAGSLEPPYETQVEGTIGVKKTGILKWKLDSITIK